MALLKRAANTDVNYSPINSIVTWILLIAAFLAVLVKILLKVIYSHSFGTDDAVISLSFIFGAAESAAASIQILHGVGRPLKSLDGPQIDVYEKAGYATELLYIISLALSKLSVLVLLRQISPVDLHRKLTALTLFWKFFGSINILTDVIGSTIAQLVFLNRLRNRDNITLDIWPYHLATQFVVCLSIVTVCIPYVRNALLGFESGMFQTGHFRLGKLGQARHDSPPSGSSNATNTDAPDASGQAQIRDGAQVFDGRTPGALNVHLQGNHAVAEATTPDDDWDASSQISQANIIKTTREWIVDYDDQNRHVGPS
ncbi:MAG: hypothetical protein Q9168_004604 [Polycauliona sp. 1 TL-2023]